MKAKLLKTLIFLSLFIFQPAYGYIINISVWKNEETGKWIYLLGDIHELGTVAVNEKQMKFFIKEVLEKFETQSFETQLLFEDQHLFFSNLNDSSFYDNYLTFFNEKTHWFGCPVNFGAEEGNGRIIIATTQSKGSGFFDGQTTWLGDIGRYIGTNKAPYQHVKLKSIDPRIYTEFLNQSLNYSDIAGFSHIFRLGNFLSEMVTYINNQPDSDPLVNELQKIQSNIEKDYEVLLKSLKNHSLTKEILSQYSIKKLLQKNLITHDDLENIKKLFDDEYFLLKTLDKIALWESTKTDAAKHSFVAVGYLHKDNLEEHLKLLGFKEVFRSKDGFLKKLGGRKFKFEYDDETTMLPVGLEEEIIKSFEYIQGLVKNIPVNIVNESSNSSSSSISSVPSSGKDEAK